LIEMMMAGATAVQIGTAIYYRGVDVFKKIVDEAQEWLEENNYENISQIIGQAHDK